LELGGDEVDEAVQGCAGHDVDEEAARVRMCGKMLRGETYLVTLSMEWKTSEFLHIAMATALLPIARQYVLMNRRLEFGKNQMLSIQRRLTK